MKLNFLKFKNANYYYKRCWVLFRQIGLCSNDCSFNKFWGPADETYAYLLGHETLWALKLLGA